MQLLKRYPFRCISIILSDALSSHYNVFAMSRLLIDVLFSPPLNQVQLFDQIVFESVKSHGHYFHASEPFQIDHFSYG